MMAAVGCMENGLLETANVCAENHDFSKLCKKNGMQHNSFIKESAKDRQYVKPEVDFRAESVMELAGIVFAKPSIPSLRSRQLKVCGDVSKKGRLAAGDILSNFPVLRRDASIIRTRRDTRSSEWRRSESGKPHISHCSSLKGSNPTSSSNSSRNNNNHLEQQGSIHSSSSHKEANDICEGSSGKNISGISSRTLKMGVLCTEKHDRGERCECEGLPASFPRPPGLHSPAFLQFPCENSTSSSQESVKRALSRKRSLDTSPHDPDDEGSSVIRRRTLRSPSTGSINGIAEHVIDKEKLSLDIAAIVNQNGVKSEPGLNGIKIVHGYQNGTRPLCCVGLDARSACSTGVTHHHPVAPLSQSSSSLSQSLTSSNCQSVRDACNSHSDIISEDAAIMSLSQSASQFSENAVAHPVQEDASRAKRPQPPSSLIPLSASSLSSSAAAVSQQQLHQQTQGSESSVIGSSFNNNNNNSSSDDTDSIKTDTTAVRSISPQPNTTVRSLRHRPATSASAQKSLSQPASPQASSSLKSESTLMTSTSLPSLSTLVAEPSSPATPSLIPCRWRGCSCELDSSDLLEHIRKHVDAQIEKKTYSCLWEDCKVFDKPSWSCSWLERHIVSHSGHRPFKCILDNCGQRFHSQVALERHVNGHFASSSQNGIKSGRTKEDISHRMLQKRKRQLNRRFVQSVKRNDFFDEQAMNVIKHELVSLAEETQLDLAGIGLHTTFHGLVVGRRFSKSGSRQILVEFTPSDILEDEWVPEEEAPHVSEISVPLTGLPCHLITGLHNGLYRRHRFRKHRRK